jgi:hypothetical protein
VEHDDAKSRKAAIERRKPLSHLGDEYAKLVVPAIPATDLEYQASSTVTAWPELLQQPLLKAKEGKIVGVQSGVRSAMICIDNDWYRLKGCGNNYDGFPIKPVDGNDKLVNIRGSTFQHTVIRELYMTDLVNKALKEEKLIGANASVGWYEYELPNTPLDKVVRCCGVFRTVGNRRLGDHVLLGLESLLQYVLSADFDPKHVRNHFGMERCADDAVSPTWIAALMGTTPLDFVEFKFSAGTVDGIHKPPSTIPQRWHQLWVQESAKLHVALPNPGQVCQLIAHLYWRYVLHIAVIAVAVVIVVVVVVVVDQ